MVFVPSSRQKVPALALALEVFPSRHAPSVYRVHCPYGYVCFLCLALGFLLPLWAYLRRSLLFFSGSPFSIMSGLYRAGPSPISLLASLLLGMWSRLSLYGVHLIGFHLAPRVFSSFSAISKQLYFLHFLIVPC